MRKIIILHILQFIFFQNITIAQNLLKEIKISHENGNPKQIDYLDSENLRKVRTDLFNQSGKKVFSMKFDPTTGLANGEFFNLRVPNSLLYILDFESFHHNNHILFPLFV